MIHGPSPRRTAVALLAALLAAFLVPNAAQAAGSAPVDTAALTFPSGRTPGDAIRLLPDLPVEAPSSTVAPADAFGAWADADADGDGCSTRSEVLLAESLTDPVVGPACTVISGEWESAWDGAVVVDGETAVVDHTVPTAEAWRSGAHAWTAEERSDFADDLFLGDALLTVTPTVSQSRADRDPSTWLPPVETARCRYVTEWVAVKWVWDLSVDPAEHAAIMAVLDGCPAWPLYKTPYSGTIYELVVNRDGSPTPVPLSFARWRDVYGFGPYERTATMIVRYPWSSTLYAMTFWPGKEYEPPAVQRLTFAQWQHTGFAAPSATDWIPGSTLHRYPTATQIFLTPPGGGVPHALTYAEWDATGFEPALERTNEGFVRLSWSSGVLHMTNLAESIGTTLTFAQWAALGFPNPQVVDRLPGDRVFRFFGSPTIYYTGGMTTRRITFAEWQRMGFRAPEVRGVPPIPADKNCSDYPDRFAAQSDLRLWSSEGYGDLFGLDADHDGVACEDYFRR